MARVTAGISVAKTTVGTTSMLATVINVEVTKTKANFFAFRSVDTWKYNAFSNHSSSRLLSLGFS